MSFQKTVEDFICQHCGQKVSGTGYTNHCPHCLWSKHVDIDPGDRQSDCGGLMEPVSLVNKNQEDKLIFRCQKCKQENVCKTTPNDSRQALLELV